MKKILLTTLTLTSIISTNVFAQSENINKNNKITKYEVSHNYSNYPINNKTSYNNDITLTKTQPWGKLHYYNNSNYSATIKVNGISKTVKPYSQASITWQHKGNKDKNFEFYITAEIDNLNGILSVAKANNLDEFQKN